MNRRVVTVGERFGCWTIEADVPSIQTATERRRTVRVRCVCGAIHERKLSHLLDGSSKSCGCQGRFVRNLRTGRPATYQSWLAMRQRCTNPNAHGWPAYGGRGIRICAAWLESYDAFLADMGPRPSKQHSLDRINPDGHYEPGNCRWATKSEQNLNRRPTSPAQLAQLQRARTARLKRRAQSCTPWHVMQPGTLPASHGICPRALTAWMADLDALEAGK